jgi:predicted GTPase
MRAITGCTRWLVKHDKKWIGKDYVRYLSNRLRESLEFREVPLRIVLRDRGEGDGAREPKEGFE